MENQKNLKYSFHSSSQILKGKVSIFKSVMGSQKNFSQISEQIKLRIVKIDYKILLNKYNYNFSSSIDPLSIYINN